MFQGNRLPAYMSSRPGTDADRHRVLANIYHSYMHNRLYTGWYFHNCRLKVLLLVLHLLAGLLLAVYRLVEYLLEALRLLHLPGRYDLYILHWNTEYYLYKLLQPDIYLRPHNH